VVETPSSLKRLPSALYTFLDEYENAKQNLQKPLKLPIGRVSFEYRKQNKSSFIIGENFRIKLQEASSGFQSIVPLFLVTQYLVEKINRKENPSKKEISVDEKRRIEKEIDNIYSNPNISEEVRKLSLERLSARFTYNSLLNIVEEPEQNLFPSSQKDVLFSLLKSQNQFRGNKLLITTHSPYIVNCLTLAVKAKVIFKKSKGKNLEGITKEKIDKLIPLGSLIDPNQLSVYQLTNEGKIEELANYQGIPSDSNFLNQFLQESNELYDQLLEIEDEL
jgi:hypothetical protein